MSFSNTEERLKTSIDCKECPFFRLLVFRVSFFSSMCSYVSVSLYAYIHTVYMCESIYENVILLPFFFFVDSKKEVNKNSSKHKTHYLYIV